MGEMASWLSIQALSSPRKFARFPTEWGRRVKWYDIKTKSYIPAKLAKQIFDEGSAVGYVAKHFTYAIIRDENGQTPST